MIKSIIILIIILYATKSNGTELSKYEINGLAKVRKVLFDFKPKVTTEDAKQWKKIGISGWDLVMFIESGNGTFHPNAKYYAYVHINEEIYFLQPGYVVSENLEDLKEYEKFLDRNRNKFLNNHAKFLDGRLLIIPKDLKNTQVKVVQKSHPNESFGFLKVKVVGKDVYFWTVKYSLL